jgi:hypothetical protein
MQNFMNMVIQPIKQLEAEYTTVTEIYDFMLSVKKGRKDRIKDKFYGFKVGQGLENLSKTQKKVLSALSNLISRTAYLERLVGGGVDT